MDNISETPGPEEPSQEVDEERARKSVEEAYKNPDFASKFRERIREMRETAADVTKALGLPPEAESIVGQALFGGGRTIKSETGPTEQNPPGTTSGPAQGK